MADDVTFQPTVATPPTGTKVATDDVGGSHYQKVKLDLGADGASAPAIGTVPVSGTVSIDNAADVVIGAIEGDTAHDAVDGGNPVKIGGKASAAQPANVAGGDRVDAWFERDGGQYVYLADLYNGALTIQGDTAHDLLDTGSPVKIGGQANAAAPPDVGDSDRVNAWYLRNGAQATTVTAAGALIGGDAANGLDVDVTRLPALPAGNNNVGDVDVASIAAGDNNIGNVDIVTMPNVTIGAAIPAGNNNIGDVDIVTVPSPLSTAGNGTAAAAHRVTIASDSTGQVTLAAGTAAIGKLAANSGVDIGDVDVTSLPALPAGTNNIGDVDVLTVPAPLSTAGNGTAATAHRVTLASDSTGVIGVTDNAGSLTVDAADGTVFVRSSAASTFPINVGRVSGNVTSVGSGTVDTGTQRVVLPTDVTVPAKETRSSTGTTTSVASSATNVTLLASNANRLGATIFNDSTQNLFVKFGATASSSSFAVKMTPGTYYEVPFNYTGIIDGIWASANGNARITELT